MNYYSHIIGLFVFRLDKNIADVNDFDREQTKRVAYSVLYGVGKDKLSDYLKTDKQEAQKIIQNFMGNCIYNIIILS